MNDCASMRKILKVDENLICSSTCNLPFFHVICLTKKTKYYNKYTERTDADHSR